MFFQIQAMVRMHQARKKYKDRLKYFKDHVSTLHYSAVNLPSTGVYKNTCLEDRRKPTIIPTDYIVDSRLQRLALKVAVT